MDDLLEAYARGTLPQAKRDELEANIEAWKDNPFNPHLIAALPHARLHVGGRHQVRSEPDRMGRSAVPPRHD